MPAPPTSLIAGLAANVWAGIRLALFLPISPQAFRVSAGHFATLFAFNVAITLLADMAKQGWPGMFNVAALPHVLSQVPMVLLAGLLIATIMGRRELLLGLAVALIAVDPLFELVGLLLSLGPVGGWLAVHPGWGLLLAYAFIIWSFALSLRALLVFDGWHGARSGAAVLVLLGLLAAFVFLVPRTALWLAVDDRTPTEPAASVAEEELFHLQPQLLQEALGQLETQRPGVVDLYFLGVAPYAREDVFVREVMSVRELFDTRFDTAGRSLVLANSPQTLADVPIATLTNLRAALERLGEVMDPAEDVLFLFITSHGDERHELAFELPPLKLQQLTPGRLARLLDEAGIKWKVVLVSACYSGGFVAPLHDPDTLVMTAADARSTSFGCESGRDYTYFGQAYFRDALSRSFSFVDAFELARQAVSERERAEGLPPSNPQIEFGTAIRPRLQLLKQRLSLARRDAR